MFSIIFLCNLKAPRKIYQITRHPARRIAENTSDYTFKQLKVCSKNVSDYSFIQPDGYSKNISDYILMQSDNGIIGEKIGLHSYTI